MHTHTHYTHELKRLSHWENVTSKATTTVLHNSLPPSPLLFPTFLCSGIEELSKNKGNCQSIGFNNFLFLQMSELLSGLSSPTLLLENATFYSQFLSLHLCVHCCRRTTIHSMLLYVIRKSFTILQIIVKGFNCIPKDLM